MYECTAPHMHLNSALLVVHIEEDNEKIKSKDGIEVLNARF